MRKPLEFLLAIGLTSFTISGQACVVDLVNMGSFYANLNAGPVVVTSKTISGLPTAPPTLAKLNIRNCALRNYRIRMIGQNTNAGVDFNSNTGDSILLAPYGVSQGRVYALTDFNGDLLNGNATIDLFFHASGPKGLRQGQYTSSFLFEISEQ